MHDFILLFISRLAVNPKSYDASGCAGCIGRLIMDNFNSGMMFPNTHTLQVCSIVFTVVS